MNEWTVVTVLAALVGLGAAVIRPLISLNSTITRLTEIVKKLESNVEELTDKNSQSHSKLWSTVGQCKSLLGEHETRLTVV